MGQWQQIDSICPPYRDVVLTMSKRLPTVLYLDQSTGPARVSWDFALSNLSLGRLPSTSCSFGPYLDLMPAHNFGWEFVDLASTSRNKKKAPFCSKRSGNSSVTGTPAARAFAESRRSVRFAAAGHSSSTGSRPCARRAAGTCGFCASC